MINWLHSWNKCTWKWKKLHYIVLGCTIMLGGLLLYLFHLTQESLWMDEAYTWTIINHSFHNIIKFTSMDFHPPLYYFLLKVFCLLTNYSIYFLRLFSVLGVFALAALGFGPVRRICGLKTGLLFSFLILLMPINLSIAHDARMYSWSAFFVTGAILYTYLAVAEGKLSDWIKFGFFTLGSAYIHYYALMAVIITNSIISLWLIYKKHPHFRTYKFALGVILVCFLPWFPILINQASMVKHNYWIPPISWKIIIHIFYYPFGEKIPYYDPALFRFRPCAFFVSFILILHGLLLTKIKKQKIFWLNLFSIEIYLLTIISGIILSLIFRPILIERYIMTVMGLFILSLAIGLSSVSKKRVFWCIIIVFLALCLPSIYDINKYRFNGPMTEVVDYIKTNFSTDTVFIHGDRQSLSIICCYFPNNNQMLYLKSSDQYIYRDAFFPNTSEGTDLDTFIKGHKNIWFLTTTETFKKFIIPSEITSKKLMLVAPPKVFSLPYSWSKVLVCQLKPK
jgi:uncharacterized membrane protein